MTGYHAALLASMTLGPLGAILIGPRAAGVTPGDTQPARRSTIAFVSTRHLTPSWSPDGRRIAFHRRVGGQGQFQLISINADGSDEKQLTFPPGFNAFPHWGALRGRAPGR